MVLLFKSYSHAFNDFALEFYNFVADNFCPYFSLPHDCADRDAPFVLDGLLYNESDLDIQEHYTDTHGFTDTNFAAFAMYGKRFSPRIKGLHKHAIFYIDPGKDYGPAPCAPGKAEPYPARSGLPSSGTAWGISMRHWKAAMPPPPQRSGDGTDS